ncbi:magnesium transporter CorA family protein [Rhizobium sp. AQ_MP]|uniref:magnesium transporter CorA family protein n=1 Tax=Rhizobium sp. AQ_MP TaxID=2761536 RepID=UPI0016397151|nr:magnesium transporter CorA family protein [Rhizobium sp. AQ_MP]MBC2773044.1 magnesium transporter CorA family protein [Rhizobium sp. AQ_MP]
MIRAYRRDGSAEVIGTEPQASNFLDDFIWIDLIKPTLEEEHFVESQIGIPLPTPDELKDIEPSSRLYVENEAIYMTASLIYRADSTYPLLTDVAFILHRGRLITIRYAEPRAFALFSASLLRLNGQCDTGAKLLGHLLETVVDRTAEILEMVASRLDSLSITIFVNRKAAKRRPPRFLEDKLLDIASNHQLVGKLRDSLVSLARLVTFLQSQPVVRRDEDAAELCTIVARDIQSLGEHAAFVGNNITFMLDASLGLINVEQNAIIKIFSIASVVFLPPTLVASIYGMNFKFMPELGWNFGYPMAILAMLLSAIIPFLFFRWKGWL